MKPTIIANTGAIKSPTGLPSLQLEPRFFVEADICPTLGSVSSELVKINRCYPSAYNCDSTKLVQAVKTIILKCSKDTGFLFKKEADAFDVALTVCDDILREAPQITLPEIEKCFYMGVRNELLPDGQEWYGLSAVTFYRFFKTYLNNNINEARAEAMRAQMAYENQKEAEAKAWKPTKKEDNIITFFGLMGLIDRLELDDELFTDPQGIYYAKLQDLKLIEVAPDEKTNKRILKEALENIAQKKRAEIKHQKDNLKKKLLTDDLADILHGKNNASVHSEGKRIYLKEQLIAFVDDNAPDGAKKLKKLLLEKLVGKISTDELMWEALRLKLRQPTDLFNTEKKWKDFLERTEELRKKNPPRP